MKNNDCLPALWWWVNGDAGGMAPRNICFRALLIVCNIWWRLEWQLCEWVYWNAALLIVDNIWMVFRLCNFAAALVSCERVWSDRCCLIVVDVWTVACNVNNVMCWLFIDVVIVFEWHFVCNCVLYVIVFISVDGALYCNCVFVMWYCVMKGWLL